MQFNIKNRVGARFKLIVHTGDGVPVRETGWFNNLVLNSGLDRMSEGVWINRCCVGSGNSLPNPTQTQLDSFIASTITAQVASEPVTNLITPIYYGARRIWRFGQGVATGNISEVGMGWADNLLWNRALVRDTDGEPTTITVLADEYLDVVVEVRVYPGDALSGQFNLKNKSGNVISSHTYHGLPYINNPSWGGAGSVTIGSTSSSATDVLAGTLGTLTTKPAGPSLIRKAVSTAYPSARKVACTLTLGLNDANGTHQSILLYMCNIMGAINGPGYQVQIDPPITKTSAQVMTYTFEMSWDRYEGP